MNEHVSALAKVRGVVPPQQEVGAEPVRSKKRRSNGMILQAKLSVGGVNDPAEHEADRIADEVVRHLGVQPGSSDRSGVEQMASTGKSSQRFIASRQAAPAAMADGFVASPDVESRIRGASSSGAPLESGVRRRFENAMGTDLGDVRIHRSAVADQLNSDLGAKAFTTGSDVFFSAGSYAPERADGQRLLAHELAHTVQQGPGVNRQVIRRFTIDAPDFTTATGFRVFAGGGSGNVAEFTDGGAPLIVKVDQLIGNEVAVAGNLHSAVAGDAGGSGGFSIESPGVRLATAPEKAAIKAAALRLIGTNPPRNFITGVDSNNPVVLMNKAGGQDFRDEIEGGGHTKKGKGPLGKTAIDKDSILHKILFKPGPLTSLAQAAPVDVAVGMFDRILGYWNPENFRLDGDKFAFVDNTQNGQGGFLTSVVTPGGPYSSKESFEDWAGHAHVARLRGNLPELADKMFTTVTGLDDTTGILADIGNDAKLKLLFEAGARKQKTKMLAWIAAGMATGKAALMRQLANPLPLVSGLPDVQKREALQNLIRAPQGARGHGGPAGLGCGRHRS